MKSLILLTTLLAGILSAESPSNILTPVESAPVLVDGLEFVVVTQAEWSFQSNVLQLRITNRGDKPMLFPTFDSFHPVLTTAAHTPVRLGVRRDKTRITPNILLQPGKGFTLSLDAKIEYQGEGKDGAFQYRDGTGTICTETLGSGSCSIAFDLCPTTEDFKREGKLTAPLWSGRSSTEPADFAVKYPQLPHASTLPLPMPDLVTKDWHSSPPDAPNSHLFGVIGWDKLPMIRIGISERELQAICPIVNPYKKVNVLLYSINPAGSRYEIGILMDGARVFDISYKACPKIDIAGPALSLTKEPVGVALSPTVVTSNTNFARDLYGKLKTRKGNLLLSPYSISSALAMTYGGARGETAEQMAKTLHFTQPQAELHPAFAVLQQDLNAVQDKGKVRFAIANSLWPQQEYAFLPDYLELCKKNYGAISASVDFKGDTEAVRKSINGWVEDKTNKKIHELFKPGMLDARTRLVLVNAIYFKGNWASQFRKKMTKPEPFHLADGRVVKVPTMFQWADLRYGETEDAQVLEMPYAGNDLSMFIMLPSKADGLPALEEKFCTSGPAACQQGMKRQKTQVWLPRFKTTSEFALNETLAALGMKDAFSQAADFSGMDGSKNLHLDAMIHKAMIEVNEEGSEAAAATAGVGMLGTRPTAFHADRPFLFTIQDNKTGSILFLGRITDPTK